MKVTDLSCPTRLIYISAVALVALVAASSVAAGSVTRRSITIRTRGSGILELPTPPEGAKTVAIAVVTNATHRFAQFDRPELWQTVTLPIGEFVVFSETPTLTHLSKSINSAAIPGDITCATFSSKECNNKRSSGKDDFHCAFNLQGPGNLMRWGVPTKPECILCLKNSEVIKQGKFGKFEVELCEPHEEMVKAREEKKASEASKKENGGTRVKKARSWSWGRYMVGVSRTR